ncbi:hypothetical protein JW859_13025 [bacterium]|nr:hypothetical protein [bacterium]
MVPDPPIVSNEVVMEALRIKDQVKIADDSIVTEDDIAANLELVGNVGDNIIKRQTVLVAIAFSYPNAKQPEA